MILYHGSNMVFKTPLLAKCSPYKDFGQGFYLSDSFDVARRTAFRAVRQRGGNPVVLVFEIDAERMRQLSFKRFAQPGNRAWAKFVLANRNPDDSFSSGDTEVFTYPRSGPARFFYPAIVSP